MNTIYYLQKIVKHMINLNNISIVFPNSSYKQIQMSGSKKTTPTTWANFWPRGCILLSSW
jgi:hypothetical protein